MHVHKLVLGLLLIAAPMASAQPWVIEDEVVCSGGEMVVEGGLVIKSGGSLELIDCILEVDSPPYQEAWLGAESEGSLIMVEEGGRFIIRTESGSASLRPHDSEYGYRVLVEGEIRMEGAPGKEVVVQGLEGFMIESGARDGLEVRGQGYFDHVRFENIQGPAVNVQGGSATIQNYEVSLAYGAFAVHNGSLDVGLGHISVGMVGLLATAAFVNITDSDWGVARQGLVVHDSTVLLRETDIRVIQGGARSHRSHLTIADVNLTSGSETSLEMEAGSLMARNASFVGHDLGVHTRNVWPLDIAMSSGTPDATYLQDVRVEIVHHLGNLTAFNVTLGDETKTTDGESQVQFTRSIPHQSGIPDLRGFQVTVVLDGEQQVFEANGTATDLQFTWVEKTGNGKESAGVTPLLVAGALVVMVMRRRGS